VSDDADGPVLTLAPRRVISGLRVLFPQRSQPRDASFVIRGGKPILVPGRPGRKCCRWTAARIILKALRQKVARTRLATINIPPQLTTSEARSLEIESEIGRPYEFGPTTTHACCEDRVFNIHRIADMVRGYILFPGRTLSLNEFVGPRTPDKGFVPAGVIYNGVFTTDIGGGVSQFATTLFNAAFFAGLDFPEYQSHSIHIDRYPYGREATISYPSPDLAIRNPTPYGVLVWPTYSDTSLTVHLFSTEYAVARPGHVTEEPLGNCTRVTTRRVRKYPDGTIFRDSVQALYRPSEGVNC
jgi:vancomycin resistance protein YoaR